MQFAASWQSLSESMHQNGDEENEIPHEIPQNQTGPEICHWTNRLPRRLLISQAFADLSEQP
jgi:hypothetical protein